MKSVLFLLIASSLTICSCNEVKTVSIEYDKDSPQASFAVSDLTTALSSKGISISDEANFSIKLILKESCCEVESYTIEPTNDHELSVTAGDQNGLMYGTLELAELVKLGDKLTEIKKSKGKPYISKRGIKFNIPLDVRTSSFDDSGDAAQENIAEMWNMAFWKEFFDNMARYRYNAISYWNAHPFSSMVKLDDYPDVALQDVCGTTIKPQENPSYWNVPELASSKIVANLKVEKKMTIEEKIKFWQEVMKYAKNRGIDVYFITWNICLNGAAVPGSNKEVGDKKGKYGISNDYKNKISKDYLRKSVKQFILNYPDLTGLGVTAGENMRKPMDDEDKEKWLWDTYGMGILDAKEVQPERKVAFIHRFWWTDMAKIMKYWGNYPDQFDMSFKYAKAHMYSAVNPPFHKPLLDWMKPQQLKSWWNLRNDDIFIHRWGDPAFVSAFIKNLPLEQTAGFHMGSDGYVWGREFISKNAETPRQLEINKHWYRFMLWGRLGYDPETTTSRFTSILAAKFPETDAPLLYKTWSVASQIIPQINRFHWRDWDFMWAPEACMDSGHDLRDVDAFRINPTMAESGIMNPVAFVEASLNNDSIRSITPLQIADSLAQYASSGISGVEQLTEKNNSKELRQTLLDIKAMSYLGQYYAYKIRGAVALEFYKKTGDDKHKKEAVRHLSSAINSWEQYSEINDVRYERQNLARLRTFDFKNQLHWVKKDIEIAANAKTYVEEEKANETK